MTPQEWSVLASEVVYDTWITVVRDRLRKPDGGELDYHYLASAGSSSVLAFTEDEQVVLTRQYRHPLRQTIFDLPAGGLRAGEEPQAAALRELAEETGYVAGEIESLGRFNPMPGTMSHTCHVFVARDLRLGSKNLDEHEVIDVVLMPWPDVVTLVLNGDAVDGSLVYAVLRYLARTTSGR
ncbi:NUDIX hydrolase [Tenggerimyces flavus]|uniref:NUDIX hydrolase n=1 Tax=Tenggerimyces flavus TaxID=1708749 RepID=A0ABV7Y5C6_9ACTN|nr:NUDIX hydrolase [Tenggerimyces flavus]MBM7791045.1 ADP-ribose pyrophosphatase [Tenggerimyces flavus]